MLKVMNYVGCTGLWKVIIIVISFLSTQIPQMVAK